MLVGAIAAIATMSACRLFGQKNPRLSVWAHRHRKTLYMIASVLWLYIKEIMHSCIFGIFDLTYLLLFFRLRGLSVSSAMFVLAKVMQFCDIDSGFDHCDKRFADWFVDRSGCF